MVDVFLSIVGAIILGASAGAFSAFLGWNKSGEPFDARKFVSGLVTGIITGVIAVMAYTATIQEAVDQTALLITYITIFIAIIGIDNVRTAVSQAVTKSEENETETV